jgi:hypothetical protein
MLIVDPSSNRAVAEAVHASLGEFLGALAAADVLGEHLLLVRLMASSGVPFREARAVARDALTGGNRAQG